MTEAILLPPIDVTAYRMALNWLLNFTAADIPAASSIAANFAVPSEQNPDLSKDGVLSRNFQSILAFPLWLFNDNNWGNTALKTNTITTTLPPEYYTVAAVVAPYGKIGFDRTMFYLFIILQGLVLVFIWAVLIWVWIRSTTLPYISSFPLFDAGTKLEMPQLSQDHSVVFVAEDSHIMELLEGEKVFSKSI